MSEFGGGSEKGGGSSGGSEKGGGGETSFGGSTSSSAPMNISPTGSSFEPSSVGTSFETSGAGIGGQQLAELGSSTSGNQDIINSIMANVDPTAGTVGGGATEFSSVGTGAGGGGGNEDIINSIMSNVAPTGEFASTGNEGLISSIMANVDTPGGLTSESLGLAPIPTGGVTMANAGETATGIPLSSSGSGGAGASAASLAGAGKSSGGGGLDLTSLAKSATSGVNPLSALLGAGALGYNIWQGQKTKPTTEALEKQVAELKTQYPELMASAGKLQTEGANIRSGAEKLYTEGAEIRNKAGQIIDKGAAYTEYLANGTLPEALQKQVDQAIAAKRTALLSNYASQGMSTDPTKNSSLRSELGKLEEQKSILAGTLAQQLLTSGTGLISSGTGLTSAGTGLTSAGTSATASGTGVTQAGTSLISEAQKNTGLSTEILKTLSNIDTTNTANIGKAIANFASSLSGKSGGINLKLA